LNSYITYGVQKSQQTRRTRKAIRVGKPKNQLPMKKNIFILAVISAFIFSACHPPARPSDKPSTAKIDTLAFKTCPVELDLPGNGWETEMESTEVELSNHKGGRFTISPLENGKCLSDLEALKSVLTDPSDPDSKTIKITEDIKLKNGFGIKFERAGKDGKPATKNFAMIANAKGKCYIAENNPYYDVEYKEFDAEKGIVESIR
jgi:hypothetical protein